MKIFLLDLWTDLRDKRLWPVAAVLLAGLVAVPIVLSKPAEEPPPPPAPTEARTAPEPEDFKGLAAVKLGDTPEDKGSSLDTFDPSNPFTPPSTVLKKAQKASGSTDAGPNDGGSTGSAADSGGDSGGGSVDSGGDTGSTGGGDTGGGAPSTQTTQYRYVVDVTFGVNGRTRRERSMEKLDMLPSQANPLLLFLGVSASAGNAVFLVDSTLQAAGEGTCKPSGNECAFLYIGAGSEHEFTNEDGDSYTLRINEIRKVKVDSASAAKASSKRGKGAAAAVGANGEGHRFVPALIADLVRVSTTSGVDSNSGTDRR